MENLLLAVVCSPFALFASILNIAFILCLRHPVAGVNLNQPLHFLLIALISNSIIQQGTILLTVILAFLKVPEWLLAATKVIVYLTYSSCFSSSAWISIFYYIKIVPQTCTVLNWIKKNIRITVYSGFILDQTVLLAAMSTGSVSHLLSPLPSSNSTSTPINGTVSAADQRLNVLLGNVCNMIFLVYLICPLFTLTVSWSKTFVYLRGHIKRMEESMGDSNSRLQKNQMRAAVMGIVQAAVFLLSCMWMLLVVLAYSTPAFERIDGNKHILITISSISDLANVVCLGLSQSVFRLRVSNFLEGLKKPFGLIDHI